MGLKYSDIVVQPLKGRKYKIVEPIQYKDVIVPSGYMTNGADIPRVFWWLYEPNCSDFLPAVILHDYLCDKEEYKKADRYFAEALELLEVRAIDRFLLINAVKLYHKIKY